MHSAQYERLVRGSAEMKVAFISSIPVFPTTEGNRRRTLNLARAVRSLGHEVRFVFLPSRATPELDRAAHEAEFGADGLVLLENGRLSNLSYLARRSLMRALRLLKRAMGRENAFHLGLDELFRPSHERQLAALQKREPFDAAIVAYIFNSRALAALGPATLRILDTHDSFADRHLAIAGARSERDYWFSVSDETERRAFRRAEVVLAIQPDEAGRFAARLGPAPRVETVSHLIDLATPLEDFSAVGGTFVGSSNGPNLVSLRFFVERTLPLITAAVPEFRLHVVGSVGARIGEVPRLVNHGGVDDLRAVYRLAPLSLNPMEAGTGINIKLLDAMAAGVGTVSTVTGSRGLGAEFAGGVVTVPDTDPRAFADAVIALSRSESERRALGAGAFAAARAWNQRQLQTLNEILTP